MNTAAVIGIGTGIMVAGGAMAGHSLAAGNDARDRGASPGAATARTIAWGAGGLFVGHGVLQQLYDLPTTGPMKGVVAGNAGILGFSAGIAAFIGAYHLTRAEQPAPQP